MPPNQRSLLFSSPCLPFLSFSSFFTGAELRLGGGEEDRINVVQGLEVRVVVVVGGGTGREGRKKKLSLELGRMTELCFVPFLEGKKDLVLFLTRLKLQQNFDAVN